MADPPCRGSIFPQDNQRRGYTMADVIGGLFILTMLTGLLLPACTQQRDTDRRAKCANNLRQIALAMIMYGDQMGGQSRSYPISGQTAGPFGPSAGATAEEMNRAANSLYLIAKTQDLSLDAFICPSTNDSRDPARPQDADQWTAATNVSYGIANPLPKQVPDGWRWTNSLGSDNPVAADMGRLNPPVVAVGSTAEQHRAANSLNHRGLGQNVAFADAYVEWGPTVLSGSPIPGTSPVQRDHIYLGGGMEPQGIQPTTAWDMAIIPHRGR